MVNAATISVLRQAVNAAKLGREEKLDALRRLDDQSRTLEATAGGPPFEQFVADEWRASKSHGGRTAATPRREIMAPPRPAAPRGKQQLSLWARAG